MLCCAEKWRILIHILIHISRESIDMTVWQCNVSDQFCILSQLLILSENYNRNYFFEITAEKVSYSDISGRCFSVVWSTQMESTKWRKLGCLNIINLKKIKDVKCNFLNFLNRKIKIGKMVRIICLTISNFWWIDSTFFSSLHSSSFLLCEFLEFNRVWGIYEVSLVSFRRKQKQKVDNLLQFIGHAASATVTNKRPVFWSRDQSQPIKPGCTWNSALLKIFVIVLNFSQSSSAE